MTGKMRRREVDLKPPEIKKLPPPARSYYAKIERAIGQMPLPIDLPKFPKIKKEAGNAGE